MFSSSQRPLPDNAQNSQQQKKSMPLAGIFLLYLILHCHYITIVGSLLDRLSSVTVRNIYFGLSKRTVFTVVIVMIGSLFNLGQWLTGSCQQDFGPACDSTAFIEFGVGNPWNPVGSGLYDAGFWKWRRLLQNIALFIRTRDLTRRAAEDLRLQPSGYWDRQVCRFSHHMYWAIGLEDL